jgi:hypothetical protein
MPKQLRILNVPSPSTPKIGGSPDAIQTWNRFAKTKRSEPRSKRRRRPASIRDDDRFVANRRDN